MSKKNGYHKLDYNAKLTIPEMNKSIDLPILEGTEGVVVVDISSLYKNDIFTFDPGFMSTASCKSSITYIDGQAGILEYRGYNIAELAEKSNFVEICYLLFYGELPTQAQYDDFTYKIKHHTLIHEQMQFMFRGFPRVAHPMAVMAGAVNSLSAFYHEHIDIRDPKSRDNVAIKVIAKIPTLAAMTYKYSVGQPFVPPKNDLYYTDNFLNMMFAIPSEPYVIKSTVAKALDVLFMLHADHEQNASTATVRLAGSSGADPFSVIGAGITALWGPAHGGANEAVIKMLEEIGTSDRIPIYIEKAKDPNDPFRLMGFGHRVYKNYDPRAKFIKKVCHDVLKELHKGDDPMLKIALELEQIALQDPYFIERKLYPNVDFYSGIIYKAIGIPTQMFTVIFAIARAAGWIAQWKEMMEDDEMRIGRPRQLYVGHDTRPYVPIKDR